MDIINSRIAAEISVDTPGRAYLARGTEGPVEFQTASLSARATSPEPLGLSVHRATDYIGAAPATGETGPVGAETTPAQATSPLISTISRLWEAMNGIPVRKPVADPLPCILAEPPASPDLHTGPTSGWSVRLGLMDLPTEQTTAPLIWEPTDNGHLGLVGGSGSGGAEAIRLAVLRLASHPYESHLYILDPDSSFADFASRGRVGARAGLHELRRAVRILERLAQEQSRRLSGRPADVTPLVLVIAGWGSWASAFRAGPLAWAEDLVHDLIRDGGRAGITVIISGQRELVTARFFAAIPNRVYFPTGSSDESRVAWPKLPSTACVTGRGVAMGALSAGRTAVCQFYMPQCTDTEETMSGVDPPEPAIRPFRIEPLPTMVSAARILDRVSVQVMNGAGANNANGDTAAVGATQDLLCIGVGGDELEPVSVRLPSGGVLAVLGGPSAGKSSFLRLLPQLNPDAGPWLRPKPATQPPDYWLEVLGHAAAGTLTPGSVALVDNADLLPHDVNRTLADLNSLGITVVITAGFSPVLSQRVPLTLQARNLGTGVLIAPRTFLDGDLFGVRFEAELNPPPGRGVLIQNGHPLAIQLGWATKPEATRQSGRRS